MVPRRLLLACAAVTAALAAAPAWAQGPASCARTTDPSAPRTATAGAPCWTDVSPYPFGSDGNVVDDTGPECRPSIASGPNYSGDQRSCYLKADSLAFRAWNRGLAATSVAFASDLSATTAFGVWLFNGARWFPDPTFPGQSVCRGNKVLWAGKRDYWLVGARVRTWPSLCRFDGVNFEWQPIDVPPATLAKVPLGVDGLRKPGAMTAGSCIRWDDCTFFGSYGTVVHWDGAVLTDASPDLAAQPSLQTDFASAATQLDAAGQPLAFAVGSSGGQNKGEQLPPRRDGTFPPQLFGSTGGPFAPRDFTPPTYPQADDPYRTDLTAVAVDRDGRGWVAGNPAGDQPATSTGSPGPGSRRARSPEPAPLVALDARGTAQPCAQSAPDRYRFPAAPGSQDGYLWSSIAVFPGPAGPTADALAGGQLTPSVTGGTANDDGSPEPLLVRAGCDSPPAATRFRIADPFSTDPTKAPLPAGRGGFVTDVAATAANDSWAATTAGSLVRPTDFGAIAPQRPHLYRFRDTEPPAAPAGDDVEPRPLIFEADPPIFVELPPDAEPPVPPSTTVTQPGPVATRQVRLKPAIYDVKSKVVASKRRRYTLEIRFRVRRTVTIGVEALRGRRVVGSSGLKRVQAPRGKLTVRLDRRRWPSRIRFTSAAPATTTPTATPPKAPR